MQNNKTSTAEIAQEMLIAWAETQGHYICQWCNVLVPMGHAYCDKCYDMIMSQRLRKDEKLDVRREVP